MYVEPVLTTNQQSVFPALGGAECSRGANTLLERLQVYQALGKLIDFGLVHRIESPNAFVVCDHHGDQSQHTVAFAICETCGVVSAFADPSVQQGLIRWTGGHASRAKCVTVEIRGLCETCDRASK